MHVKFIVIVMDQKTMMKNAIAVYQSSPKGPKDPKMSRKQAIHVSDQNLNQLLYLRGDIILLFLWQTRSFNILSAGINGFMETKKKAPCGWIRNR